MNRPQTAIDAALDSALEQFGLSSFRPGQREVISAIVAGNDCMCVMPTGGGKSLCYQLPSIIRPGLTIVVSPLIALMKDQVDSLGQRGIPAALINSTLSQNEQQERLQDVSSGKYKLVYVAPERLRSPRFLEAIRATPIQLLAIDEAHCISQWGHDFRPDYARLGKFRQWLGDVQTVALTATATPRVRQDIVEVLNLDRPKQFMSGFARPNLDFGVVQRQTDREKDEQLEQFLKREEGSGIIYAATRKRCDALVEMIQQKLKVSVGAYHAGMLPEQRRAIQERFMRNELRIIVATNAFGMGIDKPDLRFVIHYNIPGSLEAYYQEAGRAGRDGKQSQCVLLYSYQDRYIQEFFIDNNYPPREVIESVYNFLAARPEDPIELTHEEIRDSLGLSISPEAVGSSLQILARTEVIERLETGGGMAMIRIDSDQATLVDLLPKEATVRRKVLRVLERIVGQRRGEPVYVNPRYLLQQCDMERDALNRHLRELTKLKAIDYVPPFRGRATRFVKRDVPFRELEIDFEALAKRKEAEYERLNQVVRFAQTPRCRQAAILEYFGDTGATDCGHCDRCLGAQGWPKLAQRLRTERDGGVTEGNTTDAISEFSDSTSKASSNLETDSRDAAVSKSSMQTSAGRTGATLTPQQRTNLLVEIVAAIDRTHGRLGKNLIGQFLCGSNNAKIQKLRLHRLSGFGMLSNFRQNDATELIDELLRAGILQQQEVNRNRPTVSLSEEVRKGDVNRRALLDRLCLNDELENRLAYCQAQSASVSATAQAGPAHSASPAASSVRAGGPESADRESSSLARSETVASKPPPWEVDREALSAGGAVDNLAQNGTAKDNDLSGAVSAPTSETRTSQAIDESGWTWQLFVDGYSWTQIMEIRRKGDLEVSADLQQALRGGKALDRRWLGVGSVDPPSIGQQRLLRELQRRSAAGV